MWVPHHFSPNYDPEADFSFFLGDCLDFLPTIPPDSAKLVVTSPPYNIGKKYERRKALDEYLALQHRVIGECIRILADDGSTCWQVGNYVDDGEIIPLDSLLFPIFREFGRKMLRY